VGKIGKKPEVPSRRGPATREKLKEKGGKNTITQREKSMENLAWKTGPKGVNPKKTKAKKILAIQKGVEMEKKGPYVLVFSKFAPKERIENAE